VEKPKGGKKKRDMHGDNYEKEGDLEISLKKV
jgi:hypothetical protein